MTYFAYHAVQGDRGLLAWWQLRHQLEAAQTDLAVIQGERVNIEHKIALLQPGSLDRDMLDEQTRRVLAFIQPNELLIIPTN
ncbi:MAG: septum formation initiator family protein [Rhodospirillaceae bacterium]